MDEANILGENGKTEESKDAFMQSMSALNKIVTSYRTHRFLFKEEARNVIDSMLLAADKNEGDSLLTLIEAIQLMNSEIEAALDESM